MASLTTEKKLLEYENKVDKIIEDSKFRIEKYQDNFKDFHKEFQGIKTFIDGRLDNVLDSIETKISFDDMQMNFTELNNMLFTKFR
jgi:hypothetical protein